MIKHKKDNTMALEKSANVQDVLLNSARKQRVPVTIFLTNGVKLQGSITGFDNFSLVLTRGAQMQLIYKHAIATIVPAQPITLFEKGEGGAEMSHSASDQHQPVVEYESEPQ